MKLFKISCLAIIALSIAACGTSKKVTTGSTVTTTKTETKPVTAAPKSTTGLYAPGNEELVAIQAQYKDVTMQTLNEGHEIYMGVCTGCHGAKSIYMRPLQMWPDIINNMAEKAKISDAQKDAVLKYVLAIKATQPKS